ncbi:MAG: hypothetical protein EBX62_04260 [Betaproteobacteria bacterium]|nr:hypothetical protein [Betaproteobacteria bacterium]
MTRKKNFSRSESNGCWLNFKHMLHHISLGVSCLERSAAFYDAEHDAVLMPLGYTRVWSDFEGAAYTHAVG